MRSAVAQALTLEERSARRRWLAWLVMEADAWQLLSELLEENAELLVQLPCAFRFTLSLLVSLH